MPGEDDLPTFEIERRRRGWRIVEVQPDGRRSFFGARRYPSEAEARAHVEQALPRMRKPWDRLTDRAAR